MVQHGEQWSIAESLDWDVDRRLLAARADDQRGNTRRRENGRERVPFAHLAGFEEPGHSILAREIEVRIIRRGASHVASDWAESSCQQRRGRRERHDADPGRVDP